MSREFNLERSCDYKLANMALNETTSAKCRFYENTWIAFDSEGLTTIREPRGYPQIPDIFN